MSIWDELMGRLKQTGDTIKTEAAKRATQATIDQLKARVTAAADGVLDGMEEDLEKARASREGRTTHTPSSEDPVADQIISQADQPRADAERPPTMAEQRAERRSRAAAELDAIKRRMGKSED
jgi:hypothetical protein